MKLTLIQGRYFNSWEALGLGYIGAYLKRKIKGIEIGFYQGCFDDDRLIIEGSRDSEIVAFSCTTPTFPHALKIARELKKINPKIRIVVGGYHPSAVPRECLVEGIDQVVVGEGEAAMVDIVKGKSDKIIHGKNMPFDDLPWPWRRLIKNERNIQKAYQDNQRRIASFQSHRACPFRCKFCADGFKKALYPDTKKPPVRHRPVNDLLDEMEKVCRDYKLDLIKFADPTWNIDMDWVVEFCRGKIKRKFKIPFYPNIHAAVCTEEMFYLMAKANCYGVAVGIESGSSKVLRQMGKNITPEKIRKAVAWAKKTGIFVRGYFLLGMPDETEEDLALTEKFAEELGLDEYGFSILCPYPGTQMYTPEKHKSLDWQNADEYDNDFWESSYLSNQQLKKWQRYLTEKFKDKLTWHNKMVRGYP